MAKRGTAVATANDVTMLTTALQAAWLGSLGRYVQAGELVDVSSAAPADVAAWAAAGVLALPTPDVMSDLADEPGVETQPLAATIMQVKE